MRESFALEVVVTFSVPLDFDDFPPNRMPVGADEREIIEPGYEGYMVSSFPLSIRVDSESSLDATGDESRKHWCTLSQLTESSPQSALYKGHWQAIDHVARFSHQPISPDENMVSLDGYRMGLNSVGVRMRYD